MTAESIGAELQSGTMSLAEVAAEQVAEGEALSSIPVDVADALRYATEAGVLQDGAVAVSGYWDVISSVGLNLFVVAVIFGYLFCVYRYFDDIAVLFRSVFHRQVVSHDRAEERRHSEIFYGSLGKLFLLGIVFVSLLSSMFLWHSEGLLNTTQLFYTPVVAVALFVVIVMAQYALLLVIGFVTRSIYEVSALMRIRLIYFVMAVVLVAPILLMSQMGADNGYQGWLGVAQIASLLVFVLYVRESIGFFISKKVSILHWILYLCAVEILPLTLLWQGVIRLA
jgi:hypothetical protein